MKTALLLVAALSVSGCSAIRHKQHTLFCVGACIHHEGATDKEKGELPKKPAPEVTDEAAKG